MRVRPERGVKIEHRVWMQRVGGFTALPQLIRQFGIDPEPVLRSAGLKVDMLADAEQRIPYSAFMAVLGRAAEQTGCPHFGLLAGRMCRLRDLGVVGRLIRHSPTVGLALEALTVYQQLNSEGGLGFLLKRGDFVDLGYAIYQSGTAGTGQTYDAGIAVGMNIMTELCGPSWKPYEVHLARGRPQDVAQYRSFFKVMPQFDAEYSALRFPARDLAIGILDADPEQYRHAYLVSRKAGTPDLLQRVYRALRLLMLENRHSGDDLAQMLAMHRRTLNRRLKAEGTTFQRVLDEVRFDIARDLLENTHVPLDDIAATLGYAAVTPFMRTFRRWSGTTPGQWRRDRCAHSATSLPYALESGS
jgi:AraC-like DNA-binding protein